MKNRKALARRLLDYCTEHHVMYSTSASYPNSVACATKRDLRTSNGMLYHVPRTGEWQKTRLRSGHMTESDQRTYLLWYEEPFETVIEALAFLKLMSRRHVMLLSCQKRPKLKQLREEGLLP